MPGDSLWILLTFKDLSSYMLEPQGGIRIPKLRSLFSLALSLCSG